MQYRRLGQSDVEVSVVCMGCWAIADPRIWGPQDQADAIAAIRASLDAGVNFFDTAEGYGAGDSEELLGKALAGRRSEAVIASKVSPGHHHKADLTAACEASLRRLGADRIDLYMLHWPDHAVGFAEPMRALERLRDQGKIRQIGVSNFARADLPAILELGRVQADQLPYNLLWRAIEFDVQPLCLRHEVSITCYCPLMQGMLAGKYATVDDVPPERARTRHFAGARPMALHRQSGAEALTFGVIHAIRRVSADAGVSMDQLALGWLLAQPAVTSVIVGARNAEQAVRNAHAGDSALPAEIVARLTEASEPLKQHFGSDNPDMWQVPGRMR